MWVSGFAWCRSLAFILCNSPSSASSSGWQLNDCGQYVFPSYRYSQNANRNDFSVAHFAIKKTSSTTVPQQITLVFSYYLKERMLLTKTWVSSVYPDQEWGIKVKLHSLVPSSRRGQSPDQKAGDSIIAPPPPLPLNIFADAWNLLY